MFNILTLLWPNKWWYCDCRQRSPEWTAVPDEERCILGLVYDHDGEFWFVVVPVWGLVWCMLLVHCCSRAKSRCSSEFLLNARISRH